MLLLQGTRRIRARELAAKLEVSVRTVYRDVEALCEAGVPIHMERGRLGGIVLSNDYRRAIAHFTDDEVRALFVTGPGPMNDIGVPSQTTALLKLAGALPAMQRRAADASRERLFVDQHRWSRGEQPTQMLIRLRKAAEHDRRVRLKYRDRSGALSARVVDPLGLVAKAGVWYLIAREAEKGYRTFRAQRIADVDELVESFARPLDFNLERYWSESVRSIEGRSVSESYDVVVRVPNTSVTKLAPYWDVVIERADAWSSTLRITFPTRDVAIAQLLVLADSVEILSPAHLPAAIVERARRAIRTHEHVLL